MTDETVVKQPHDLAIPDIRTLTMDDLRGALRAGWDDFTAMPSHGLFLVVIYPVIGLVLAAMVFGYKFLELLYPLAGGFVLIGPVAALGLYELSRRRERGLETQPSHALDVINSRQIGAIARLGLALLVIFALWIVVANLIWHAFMGDSHPLTFGQLLAVLETGAGIGLLLVGSLVGALFALLVLSIAVISFPLLLDRDVEAVTAAATSLRAVRRNPVVLGTWGLIVGALLLAGAIPAFAGLIVVLPVLGHATWHLYRRTVV
jgi:uncharacterized membrane protein